MVRDTWSARIRFCKSQKDTDVNLSWREFKDGAARIVVVVQYTLNAVRNGGMKKKLGRTLKTAGVGLVISMEEAASARTGDGLLPSTCSTPLPEPPPFAGSGFGNLSGSSRLPTPLSSPSCTLLLLHRDSTQTYTFTHNSIKKENHDRR